MIRTRLLGHLQDGGQLFPASQRETGSGEQIVIMPSSSTVTDRRLRLQVGMLDKGGFKVALHHDCRLAEPGLDIPLFVNQMLADIPALMQFRRFRL